MFALICNNKDSSEHTKKYEIIFDKIQNIEVEVIEEVLYNKIEDGVFQMFLCDGAVNIKVQENTSKN